MQSIFDKVNRKNCSHLHGEHTSADRGSADLLLKKVDSIRPTNGARLEWMPHRWYRRVQRRRIRALLGSIWVKYWQCRLFILQF